MNSLNVPYFKQERSLTCGIACLRMILAYNGIQKSERELLKDIKVNSQGTFTSDLGVIALNFGFKVKIYTMHLRLLGPLKLKFGTKITSELIKNIRPTARDKIIFESWKRFLARGGEIIWETPRISTLNKYIENNIPCMINVNTASLNNYWKHWDNGHYLVIDGIGDKRVEVLDPDSSEQKYLIDKEILIPSWSINSRLSSGYLMVVEK